MTARPFEHRPASPTMTPAPWTRTAPAVAVRVFVVEDYPIFRRGLASTLAAERDLQWVGEAENGADAVRSAPALDPDVVLIDHDMQDMDGVGVMQALAPVLPAARFVLFTGRRDPLDVRRAVAAGASCVLLKSAASQELVTALHAVHRGLQVHSPALTVALASTAHEQALGADLTRRERSLLALMAAGLANREISARLQIALPTVKFHVTNILAKLHVENRTAAVLAALRHKLVGGA